MRGNQSYFKLVVAVALTADPGNMENAFETRTVNLETDKSHSEKPALVHSEQKKLKGFTLAVRRLSGVGQKAAMAMAPVIRRTEDGGPRAWDPERPDVAGRLCLHLALVVAIYENSFWSKFQGQPYLGVCCESFLTTGCQKLCKLWPNNGRQLCDFSVLISMLRIVLGLCASAGANQASFSIILCTSSGSGRHYSGFPRSLHN